MSSVSSFSERMDKRLNNSISLLVVELLGVSCNILYCFTFDRSICISLPLLFLIFQQFENYPVAFPARDRILAFSQSELFDILYLIRLFGLTC